ncbi:MAG: hypothetical protein AB1635_18540 [Acidobacteriota bacterium]
MTDPAAIASRLRTFYGLQPRPPADLFEAIVWDIVSRDALPARRDLAWRALQRLPALTPDAAFRVKPKELQAALALAGPHAEQRLERMRGAAGEIRRQRDLFAAVASGEARLRASLRALARVPGLDRAGRHRALLFGVGRCLLPADAGLERVLTRLGLAPRRAFARRLPPDLDAWRDAALYLEHHARHTCLPVGPHCNVCRLAEGCPEALRQKPEA